MSQPLVSADEMVERLFGAALGMFDIASIQIGDQLGFYELLARGDALTSAELAAAASTHERYTREWLEQQGATGFIACANPEADPLERRYTLPVEYHDLFVNPESLSGVVSLAQIVIGSFQPLDRLIEVFRAGGGIPYEDYGRNLAEGMARFSRPIFRHQLAQEWLAGMPDIAKRFAADPPARVADVGMGYGWSSVYLAEAFPKIRVDGFDLDEASVKQARALHKDSAVTDRVQFHCKDAGDSDLSGAYDFAIAIECIHDMSDPVSVLDSMRRLVGPGGTVLIADELASDEYTAPGTDMDRYLYGFSVLHCLPAGMAEQPSVGTGTVFRTETMLGFAEQAGFQRTEVLPIESVFYRFYRLTA